MDTEAVSSAAIGAQHARPIRRNGLTLFAVALRERPLRASLGLGLEYAMFAAGVGLALGLLCTRVPLRIADRILGSRMRERCVELLARISPG